MKFVIVQEDREENKNEEKTVHIMLCRNIVEPKAVHLCVCDANGVLQSGGHILTLTQQGVSRTANVDSKHGFDVYSGAAGGRIRDIC